MLIYQVHNGPIHDALAVYDKAAALEFEADQPTLSALQSGTVSAGKYQTCLNEGYIRLGSIPVGGVTADVQGQIKQNLILASGDLSDAAWSPTNATISSDASTAFADDVSLDRVTASGAGEVQSSALSVVGGQTYTLSFVADGLSGTSVAWRVYDETNATEITSVGYGSATMPARIEGNFTVPSSSTQIRVSPVSALADGESIDVGAVQLELGTKAGAYVPTSGTAVNDFHRTVADISRDLLVRKDFLHPFDDIDTASFDALNEANSMLVGRFIQDDVDALQVLNDFASSVLAWISFTLDGRLKAGLFDAPNGTPVQTFTKTETIAGRRGIETRNPVQTDGIPIWKVKLSYRPLGQAFSRNAIAEKVQDESRLSFLENATRSVVAKDASIRDDHPSSDKLEWTTLLRDKADAQAVADRIQALLGVERKAYSMRETVERFVNPNLNDVVELLLEDGRLGLETGKKLRTVSVTYRLQSGVVDVEGWG